MRKCWNSGLPVPPPCTASRGPESRPTPRAKIKRLPGGRASRTGNSPSPRSRDRDGRKYQTVCRQIPFRSMCPALPHRNAASHRGISVFRTDATSVRRRQGALPRVSSPAVCGGSAPGVSRPAARRRQGWARACASPSASCLRRAALLYLPVTGLSGPRTRVGNVPCTGLSGPSSPCRPSCARITARRLESSARPAYTTAICLSLIHI